MKDKTFVFKRTQNEYLVVGEAEMKDPGTREWVPCVIYKPVKDLQKTYVREKNDFLQKFDEKDK